MRRTNSAREASPAPGPVSKFVQPTRSLIALAGAMVALAFTDFSDITLSERDDRHGRIIPAHAAQRRIARLAGSRMPRR
jgi:hypothetical protein